MGKRGRERLRRRDRESYYGVGSNPDMFRTILRSEMVELRDRVGFNSGVRVAPNWTHTQCLRTIVHRDMVHESLVGSTHARTHARSMHARTQLFQNMTLYKNCCKYLISKMRLSHHIESISKNVFQLVSKGFNKPAINGNDVQKTLLLTVCV